MSKYTQICEGLAIYQTALDITSPGQVDPVANPYAPGAGRPPASLVGRDRQRAAWLVSLDRLTAGRTSQSVVL